MKKQNHGISLISLIITIIVIIILAAIVIFSGMGTPEKAQLSAVISDIDNVQTAVDQAYYGFYTEKSVEGEVWTKGQFYEAVATGETNRDNLTGIGIVPISEEGMVKMNLPKYEGRSWGVAVEDIDDTIKTGSVVLFPGFVLEKKVYSTVLDVQAGGSTGHTVEIQDSTVKELTKAEREEFFSKVHIGDYVNYEPNNDSSTIIYANKLYDATSNEQIKITSGKVNWRVLDINEKTGDLLLTSCGVPTLYNEEGNTIEGIKMGGALAYLNGPSELNRICKELYSNYDKRAIARSMKKDDLLKFSSGEIIYADYYSAYYPAGTEVTPNVIVHGKEYKGIAPSIPGEHKFYTYDNYETGEQITTDVPVSPTLENPILLSSKLVEFALNSISKEILGDCAKWLADRSTLPAKFFACFTVESYQSEEVQVADSGRVVGYVNICGAAGTYSILFEDESVLGLSPLLSLKAKYLNISEDGRDGSGPETAWNLK